MKTVLLLGGSSFIGIPVLRRLAQHKEWNIITTYYQHKLNLAGVEWRKVEVTNQNELRILLNELKPDIVIKVM